MDEATVVMPQFSEESPAPFLRAQWKLLVMLNYEIDPAVLEPFVPAGTELDTFNGTTYVSMVGFLFLNTRVLGVPVPFHRNFEEVNLRFYVRRQTEQQEIRRGVVFVKEIVPKRAIAFLARKLYQENYVAMPMAHEIAYQNAYPTDPQSVCYKWKFRSRWNALTIQTSGAAISTVEGTEEEFITEHYWGYTRHPDGSTSEYRVEHPRWQIWKANSCALDCDVAALYGPQFSSFVQGEPSSAFLADGSDVIVRMGRKLRCGSE
ncbi:MAG: DUF2071 domain-containing protein [Bdellovibrionales bacterium]|nr:DUF2071 domain-containing protein [Bdellovibrionales bacterium]